MAPIKATRHLTLVYSSSPDEPTERTSGGSCDIEKGDPWLQLDLFATEASDTVVYTSPDHCNLPSILTLLESAHIRQIFDFREIPHLAFAGSSRARFFEALAELNVKYHSSLALETMERFFEGTRAINLLMDQIVKGPTMIFSDLEPKDDPDVARLNSALSSSGVSFRPVFVNLREAG